MSPPPDITIKIPLGNNPLGNNVSNFGITQSLLKTASNRFQNGTGNIQTLLFPNKPGRLFGNKNSFYYNSGTSNTGAYIPPFAFKSGRAAIQTLRSFNEVQLPKDTNGSIEDAKTQLDLKPNSDGTFTRDGFNGKYTVRADGGIEFSGGFHINNGRPIQCPPQVYFPGQGWFELGNKSSVSSNFGSSSKSDSFTSSPDPTSGGFGGSLTSLTTSNLPLASTPPPANPTSTLDSSVKDEKLVVKKKLTPSKPKTPPPSIANNPKNLKSTNPSHLA